MCSSPFKQRFKWRVMLMRKNIIFCSLSKQREIAEAGGYSWMF